MAAIAIPYQGPSSGESHRLVRCLGDDCQSSVLYGSVGSGQVRLGGVSGECGLVRFSCGLWNDRENDQLSKQGLDLRARMQREQRWAFWATVSCPGAGWWPAGSRSRRRSGSRPAGRAAADAIGRAGRMVGRPRPGSIPTGGLSPSACSGLATKELRCSQGRAQPRSRVIGCAPARARSAQGVSAAGAGTRPRAPP
jgi:hypothetical protein